MASFLAGVFLDVDHILDCYLNYGLGFKLKDIYHTCIEIRLKRIFLFFHSFELIILFWIFVAVFSPGNIWKGVAIGITQHLIFDQLTNIPLHNVDGRAYFFLFRLFNGFDKDKFVKGKSCS